MAEEELMTSTGRIDEIWKKGWIARESLPLTATQGKRRQRITTTYARPVRAGNS